jgi:hypothetical protein
MFYSVYSKIASILIATTGDLKMLNKPTMSFISLLSFSLSGTGVAQTFDCLTVAEIYPSDAIHEVFISRDEPKKSTWAISGQQLCAGELVIAPNRAIEPPITIGYETNPPMVKTLNVGEQYRVEKLDKPCGTGCRVWNDIKRLYHKLTSQEPENTSDGFGVGKGAADEHEPSPIYDINMPLDAGEGFDYPFDLFARPGAIPLFWKYGQPPYQLNVTDANGNVIVDETLNTNRFSLTVPNTAPAQTYTLTISSAQSAPYRKQLVFSEPPAFSVESTESFLPVDKLYVLARLLTDTDKNWRLEIWRQLATLPKTEKRQNFEVHLILDDIDL